MGQNKYTHLCKVKVSLLLQPLQMVRQLTDLVPEMHHGLARLCRSRPMAADWRLPTCPSGVRDAERPATTAARRGEGCDGGRWVGGGTFAPCDGVIALATIILIPEPSHPLQKFEVVPL